MQLTAPLRDAYNKSRDRESATFESNFTANSDVMPSSLHGR